MKTSTIYGYTVNRQSAHDVYSKNKSIGIKKLTIIEWLNYKHLEWITIRIDDDKLYTFKEGKLANLNIEERLALDVSIRMLTRSTSLVGDCTGETYDCWKGPYDLSYVVLISQVKPRK
ncbi:hypothetical protein Tco_1373887 [Tanacetum coccineum]